MLTSVTAEQLVQRLKPAGGASLRHQTLTYRDPPRVGRASLMSSLLTYRADDRSISEEVEKTHTKLWSMVLSFFTGGEIGG